MFLQLSLVQPMYLPKRPFFELHLGAAAIALDARPFVALELELPLLHLVAIAIRVVTADAACGCRR